MLRIALLVTLVSCGGGGVDGDASCTFTQSGIGTSCVQYLDGDPDTISYSCSRQGGKYDEGCALTDLLGCCAQPINGMDIEACYYADSGKTAAEQMAACDGTWSTTP